jgi:hypothetical protein
LNWDHSEVFAVLAVAGVGAFWKAASLRGDLGKEWNPRVEDTEIALADRATIEAVRLQAEITEMIGSGEGSLPRLATVDPHPLLERAEDFKKTLLIGARVPRDLTWFLHLGEIMAAAAVAFLLGLAAIFCDSSELLSGDVLRVAGIVLCGLSVVVGLFLGGSYFVLNQRLSGAELRGQEDPR